MPNNYVKNNEQTEHVKCWDKRTRNFEKRRKGFKPNKSFRNNSINFSIIINEHILKVKHNKTLKHQKENTFLIIMLKTMNKKNLQSVWNVNDLSMQRIVRIEG